MSLTNTKGLIQEECLVFNKQTAIKQRWKMDFGIVLPHLTLKQCKHNAKNKH